jgi:hypothetical protein
MTEHTSHPATTDSNIEISHDGHAIAHANITVPADPHGTTQAAFHANSGQLPPGTRRDLVDAVLDLPDVRNSDHLRATVPLGDTESLDRLRERTTDMSSRAAGSTALVDADIAGNPKRCPDSTP